MISRMRLLALGLGGLVGSAAVVSWIVEREADPLHEHVGGVGPARALVLFHPSRDARFSNDLSRALADGFLDAALAVDLATMTGETPTRPLGYAVVGVVANTYWWTPDLPTLRYLERARLDGVPVVGLIGGAGATGRSERILRERLEKTGARVLEMRSFWLLRPNDERRMEERNRDVALDLARRLGRDVGKTIGGSGPGR